ncbi:MAG: Rieske 2Fe-2S domain-containing protein [SAR202 cluster bacterium]|nr:Rieske 2Fe-2S domain-containing protein [SAR202 cluster bacterium]
MVTSSQAVVPDFVPLCKTSDVRPGEGRMFRPQAGKWRNKSVAVFNDNGKFHVTNFYCPHSGGPMSEGTIKAGVVECPLHAWTFNAETGQAIVGAPHTIATYETKIEGDQIFIGNVKHG